MIFLRWAEDRRTFGIPETELSVGTLVSFDARRPRHPRLAGTAEAWSDAGVTIGLAAPALPALCRSVLNQGRFTMHPWPPPRSTRLP